jgi:uncharacterized protein (TIGR02996 family)
MLDDEPFLRAILASPDDRVARLVYADWLDERSDARAEFFRVEARLAAASGPAARAALAARMAELQRALPRWWLWLVGGLRTGRAEPDPLLVEVAALALGRRPRAVDNRGYTTTIEAAALCPLGGRVAVLESRVKEREGWQDIRYDLRLRDFDGNATSWEPETYNPYFGCRPGFFDWLGDAVLFVYREKHRTYAARVSFGARPDFREIGDEWVLCGRALAHRGWGEEVVRRVALPGLEESPPLSVAEASELGLLPAL